MKGGTHKLNTRTLSVEYLRWGPADGRPVLLLHGWPDSRVTWAAVATALAEVGCSVYAPSLRGFGGTRFTSPSRPRSGQLSALAQDVVEFADALALRDFTVIGHDWGARAAYISACLWPNRVQACAALSVGWGTNSPNQQLSLKQVQNYWYHWYMSTPRGEALVRKERHAFTRYIWDTWCPFWKIDDAAFAATASAFDNPDWVEVVLHSYRHRWGWAPADPDYDAIESRLTKPPKIAAPTLVLHGTDDPCNAPASSEGREAFFAGPYRRLLIDRCGHFPQREQPAIVARHLIQFLEETA